MDHIVSHSSGGDRVDNLLPAHAECNSTRWHFSAEEWRIIMKLGVFARDKIEKLVDREQCHSNGKSKGGLGHEIAKAFIAKEEARIKKQKKK